MKAARSPTRPAATIVADYFVGEAPSECYSSTAATVINEAGATISAYSRSYAFRVYAFGAPATVLNSGNIVSNGDGVRLSDGGVVNNAKGGTISGANVEGVRIFQGAGAVTNAGAISGKVGVSIMSALFYIRPRRDGD